MSSTYRLTVKFASPGTPHFNQETNKLETSTFGHVWLEARKPGENLDEKPSFSAGWSTGNSWFTPEDNISYSDWEDYRDGNGKQIDYISVDISKEQFNKLLTYPSLVATNEVYGFEEVYNGLWNSCIDFSGKGLSIIDLANKDFDGSASDSEWAQPQRQIKSFLDQIVKYKSEDASVTIKFRGKEHILENNEDINKFWKKIAPNWDWEKWEVDGNIVVQGNNLSEKQYYFNINDLPKHIYPLFNDIKGHLEVYHEKNNLLIDEEKLQNSAMALTALGESKGMTNATLFNVKNGQYLIGERNPHLNRVSMDINHSTAIPAVESLSQIQQTVQQFEYEEQQKQIAQSQARSMSLS